LAAYKKRVKTGGYLGIFSLNNRDFGLFQNDRETRDDNKRGYSGSAAFLFHGYEIRDSGINEGGDMSLSPDTAPALGDDDVAHVLEVSHRESHSGRDETPSGRSACK